MIIEKISLDDIRWISENYLIERLDRIIKLNIHITTALEKVKANIQGKADEYDILVSGSLNFSLILKAIAHEITHIILPYENDDSMQFLSELQRVETDLNDLLEGKNEKGI